MALLHIILQEMNKVIVYAHRGASEYAPENTLMSFYLGMLQGANGIETDVRVTKDQKLILFHDSTVDRVTNGTGNVEDFTYDELLQLDVIHPNLPDVVDKIPLFEDFLRLFSFRPITFAIELKSGGIEKRVIDLLERYDMRDKTIITSFEYDYIKAVKKADPRYRVGWLIKEHTEETLRALSEIGAEQICPRATFVTPEYVSEMKEKGLDVRAWGVKDTDLMENCCKSKVDGMTVNFPDKLLAYLK